MILEHIDGSKKDGFYPKEGNNRYSSQGKEV